MPHAGTGFPFRRCGAAALLACALLGLAARVPGAEATPPAACRVRVILGLVQAMPPPPDDTWVQDLAAANGVQLHYLRAITPRLYVFSMSAAIADGGCDAAIARLRRDSRLRSAQIDQRREHDPA
jgi:hypothetical protein